MTSTDFLFSQVFIDGFLDYDFLECMIRSRWRGGLKGYLGGGRVLTLTGATLGIIFAGIITMEIEIAKSTDAYLVDRYATCNCACNN